jgi:hypothetical protein
MRRRTAVVRLGHFMWTRDERLGGTTRRTALIEVR